jgi:hypothetical protein
MYRYLRVTMLAACRTCARGNTAARQSHAFGRRMRSPIREKAPQATFS